MIPREDNEAVGGEAGKNPIPEAKAHLYDLWLKPGGWVAWGLENGQFDVRELVQGAQDLGLGWIGVDVRPANVKLAAELRVKTRDAGLGLVVWEWATGPLSLDAKIDYFEADGAAANVEHVGSWRSYAATLRTLHPTKPLGLFTNFAGVLATPEATYDAALAKPWIENDFAWITEAYVVNEEGEQPTLSPESLDWTARFHGGVPVTFPAFGIYRCGPERYEQWAHQFPGHSWYLLEYHPRFL